MVQLKANEQLGSLIGQLKESAEVLDDAGRVLGYFTPVEDEAEILRRMAHADHETGEYQRRRARSEGNPGFTTEQVLAHLKSLETS